MIDKIRTVARDLAMFAAALAPFVYYLWISRH